MGKTRRWDPDYGYSSFKKPQRKNNPSKRPFYETSEDDMKISSNGYKKNYNLEADDEF